MVFKGVFLLDFMGTNIGFFGSNNSLDFIGIDDSSKISIFHGVSL